MTRRHSCLPVRFCAASFLVALCAAQCPMQTDTGATDENGNNSGDRLAVFQSSDGSTTTTVHDLNETPLQFDAATGTLRKADGTQFGGWTIDGNTLTFGGQTYTVNFGNKDGQPRAYLTNGTPPKLLIVRVTQGQLEVLPTLMELPASAMTARAEGRGIYAIAPGLQGMFVIDTVKGYFICSAFAGGTTIAAPGNFTMVISGLPPFDPIRFDTVRINGVFKNRVQFAVRGISATVNNDFVGLPGDQSGGPEILFDEFVECTLVVEVVDDDQGGDRYRATVYDSTLWPDGTEFKNFDGADIATATVRPLLTGNITVTPP